MGWKSGHGRCDVVSWFPPIDITHAPFQRGCCIDSAPRSARSRVGVCEGALTSGRLPRSRGAYTSPVTRRQSSPSCARRLVTEHNAIVYESLERPTVEFDVESTAVECAYASWSGCVLRLTSKFRGTAAVIASYVFLRSAKWVMAW